MQLLDLPKNIVTYALMVMGHPCPKLLSRTQCHMFVMVKARVFLCVHGKYIMLNPCTNIDIVLCNPVPSSVPQCHALGDLISFFVKYCPCKLQFMGLAMYTVNARILLKIA